MFDDRIEFYSPGDLLPGVTVERMQRLESQSKLRNPILVEVFRDLGGFIEKMGTGVQRMARAMAEHGLPPPRFEELGGEFRVTLVGPGERMMQAIAAAPLQGLNDRQIQLVQFVQRHGRITRRQYEELTQIGSTVAKQDVQGLMTRGLLVRRGGGPSTYYVSSERSHLSDDLPTDSDR